MDALCALVDVLLGKNKLIRGIDKEIRGGKVEIKLKRSELRIAARIFVQIFTTC